MTLIDFLTARLDEDEAAALSATSGPWRTCYPHDWDSSPFDEALVTNVPEGRAVEGDYITPAAGMHGDDGLRKDDAQYIARQDPVRALAEINVKRRMIEATQRMAIRLGVYEEQTVAWEFLSLAAEVYHQHTDWRADWCEHREEWE